MYILKNITFLFIVISISCNSEYKQNGNLTIEGRINGLTKGTVYLKKKIDTTFVAIDSCQVNKSNRFVLTDNLESPEIYYLKIKEIPKDSVLIFAEKGILEFNSSIDKFALKAKVKGSENHKLLESYREMNRKFNDAKLDLYKLSFDANKEQNKKRVDSLNMQYNSLLKRQYLYTTNFAVKHANKEIAPYLALTQLYNANISLLDTVNNSLSKQVMNSTYGKQLGVFVDFIKKNEPIK